MSQTQSQYSLSWDSFKTNICSGFSSLQQNGEFVDMTLAADGHFVKVHQVLIALSSSYLKKLITSAPCQHPVIFLNNVSHKVLNYLLEYIYTGEVLVPSECLAAFSEAAQALHIKGLENVPGLTKGYQTTISTGEAVQGAIKRKHFDLEIPSNARKVLVKPEGAHMSVNQTQDNSTEDYCDLMDDSAGQHSDDDLKHFSEIGQADDSAIQSKTSSSNLLYSMSIRGSLQVILNRYIYNLNSGMNRNGARRWRCVDYRNRKCNARLYTKGNIVVNRSDLHNHPFHDKKILAKMEKKSVFSAIEEVEAYKEKEQAIDKEAAIVDDDFLERYKNDKID